MKREGVRIMSQKSQRRQSKEQLLHTLILQGKRKGFIRAETIQKQFAKFSLREVAKEDLFQVFELEGIEIVFPEVLEDLYRDDNDESDKAPDESEMDTADHGMTNDDNLIADPIRLYLSEIHKFPTLTHKETLSLVKRMSEGDPAARDELVNCNLKFAFTIAAKYTRTGIPLLDLIQQANMGLIQAADKYNPNRGTKFTTYSVFWIKQSIFRYIDNHSRTIKLPVYISTALNKIKKVRTDYYTEHLCSPTDDEIATLCGFSIARVKYLLALEYTIISADMQPDEEMDGTIMDTLSDSSVCPDPYVSVHTDECRDAIYAFLNKLNEREKSVLILRFGLKDGNHLSLDEVGKKLNLTRERIRQLESMALSKLRDMPNIGSLYGYLSL
ncbi:MAG TPA: hypothetical protein DDZ89_21655 [Clostridiales bacterium]|nr:hypothetical protein [Clostridiales bacterium]